MTKKATGARIRKIVSAGRISKTKALNLLETSGGKFVTIAFLKKNGEKRILNGRINVKNFKTPAGNIRITETKGNKKRQFDPQSLKEVSVGGNIYKVR